MSATERPPLGFMTGVRSARQPKNDIVRVGDPMPRLGSVTYHDGFGVAVQWRSGLRAGVSEIVDLAPDILSYKSYRPLCEDRKLFKTVHLINNGTAIAWGSDDNIAMAATTVERLAEETTMDASDFRAWRKRHHLTNEAAAAHLGISRRLVGYYASKRQVPKYITLACRYLDLQQADDPRMLLLKALSLRSKDKQVMKSLNDVMKEALADVRAELQAQLRELNVGLSKAVPKRKPVQSKRKHPRHASQR